MLHPPDASMKTWWSWIAFLTAGMPISAVQPVSSSTHSIMRPWIPPASLTSFQTACAPADMPGPTVAPAGPVSGTMSPILMVVSVTPGVSAVAVPAARASAHPSAVAARLSVCVLIGNLLLLLESWRGRAGRRSRDPGQRAPSAGSPIVGRGGRDQGRQPTCSAKGAAVRMNARPMVSQAPNHCQQSTFNNHRAPNLARTAPVGPAGPTWLRLATERVSNGRLSDSPSADLSDGNAAGPPWRGAGPPLLPYTRIETYLMVVNSSMPQCPPSRPTPLSPTPPIGTSVPWGRRSFTPTKPQRKTAAVRNARARSRV